MINNIKKYLATLKHSQKAVGLKYSIDYTYT